jgi:phage protein, putative
VRERDIEQALVRSVRKADGLCLKFSCSGMNGVPDRLVLLPGGKCAFVELKTPGKKPRPLQIKRMKQISALGISCFVIDGIEQIGGVIDEISSP